MSRPEQEARWRLDWPTSAGGRVARARLKCTADDFLVDEQPEQLECSEPSGTAVVPGSGEHLCLRLEKRGDNTEYVARELARLAGCRPFDVGFCGLKDRHAVTRQWFSLYRPGGMAEDTALTARVSERWPVLSVCRLARKLRRGDHEGNRFVIVLREVCGERQAIDQALERLRAFGAPNYFGPQRFGTGGANLDKALAIDPSTLNRRGKKGRGRAGSGAAKDVLYFSAARSWLFNEVLAARVVGGSWRSCLDGEPAGTGDDALASGPLWGDGGTLADGELGTLERGVVAATPELEALFATTRMKPERRPLVARARNLQWHWLEDSRLQLSFALAPGQYATTLLNDIFELEDMSLSQHNKQQG
ncbi:MAG TPA: tRNA pseudouridine(13) synthase TruD [Marinobacter sp.]|uniref:tRNA pseudouridine(13) synthase TruD n=1 Tax=Marinobacter sp. TaxID=50741 RepID=UPI002D7FFD07|nr:tRNA pseudouridine(13) synthase TruD [Marinobacter sp.]HET8801654.1 tRNA pseudouridine(13) synthase TruD [Marinobacter sp.]